MKRIKGLCLVLMSLFVVTTTGARADMPQTDADLVAQMDGATADKVIAALEVYYDLHVSELVVQNMNEQRTGAMFALQRATAGGKSKQELAKLQQRSKEVAAERTRKIEENQNLRVKLESLSGIGFLNPLVMAPDAPMAMKAAPSGTSADLVQAQKDAWAVLEKAQAAWQEERLILLDAQQRYDETRDVPIGDHLRAMTRAEIALAEAVGACRLIEAKIAAAGGQSIADVLSAL